MNDCEIMVRVGGREVPAAAGELLGDALLRAKIQLPTDCGGMGLCGQCQVKLRPIAAASPPSEAERAVLSADQLASGYRLACQATVLDSLEAEPLRVDKDGGQAQAFKSRLEGKFAVSHGLRRIILTGDDWKAAGTAWRASSLISQVGARAGEAGLDFSASAIHQLAEMGSPRGDITLVADSTEVFSVLPGKRSQSLGLAVDLGTTTIGAYLCDMVSGQILVSDSTVNPQRRFGEDVISRISVASAKPSLVPEIKQLAVSAINHLINSVCAQAQCSADDIDEVCLVGNPTMQTLFLGLNPRSLGLAPYLPVTNESLTIDGRSLGLKVNGGTRVHILPMVSGFIGGDAIAMALRIEQDKPDGPVLALDLGTNGELVLLNDGQAWAASAATGPAFEGANIERGMRAAPGAVDRMWWDQASSGFGYLLSPGLEHNGKALGLCGSGLIDAVAVLLEQGAMDPSGRLVTGAPGVVSAPDTKTCAAQLLPPEACADGKPLYLTQQDIRQVQLAKAALRVGQDYLMELSGCSRVAHTVITGAFGVGFHWPSAMALGMLPDEKRLGVIEALPNAAGAGAVMALLDAGKRRRARELGRGMRVIELNRQADFNDRFIQALNFPPRPGSNNGVAGNPKAGPRPRSVGLGHQS
ncbi:MAG: DUF4445 domain-containing protein [Proteobacteria bacterium]|nr:DUF4445 domain-containing protein [Pseudomonadota bacterium]MBU1449567.1 DUF4445 domain-containing protein [Pseudomonadota bacterium]MBU2470576.1 DUF4445 domain-containing protein [Pseudomonadota bacterium]MBU2516864.1 DUF4445 domain-containing protein [Pseudomonadota bacterium]